ncbi:unnamed protein product [Spodoptera littoralis]|uniref:Succinate dehydrogenase cytochrome b560 subunit, mitochondrial n=2 Tax=Spodoptera TaxID=7106 RepID=A0A9P0HZ93_SPOLI|nr:succinate dehydrogenase cytochrome b560 subunit, mitochondrial-like [Spodoptera litura]CAB3507079.1 unnamed protein product [Spodoptera littoralis]CAH1636605.1 unnamed protein product [Spodoptera littoralis]
MAFFNCGRLGSRSLLASINKVPTVLGSVNYAQAAAGAPKIVFKKFEPPKIEHHDDRNARLKRPMSPHLSIYAPQLTSILSVTHRATGIILSGYFGVLGIGALVLPQDISHYIAIIENLNLSPATLFVAKFLLAAPVGYHFANGIRHLVWDMAKGLTIKEVYSSGYAMLGLTIAITTLLASL